MCKLLCSAFLLSVLAGCKHEGNHTRSATNHLTPQSGRDSSGESADSVGKGVPIRPGKPEFTYREPSSGIGYLINPGWKSLLRRRKEAAQSSTPLQSWTDWSGQVETRVYECASPTFAHHQNSIGCQVEADFILVGGGAYVEYQNGPGALLWESRPLDPGLSTWVASSKDHEVSSPHRLSVYAIGLRLKTSDWVPIAKSAVQPFIMPAGHNSGYPSHAPVDSVGDIASGTPSLFFGSGARLNWTCCGALLTQSIVRYDSFRSIGIASGKVHRYPDPSTIDVYGIGMHREESLTNQFKSHVIPGFGRLEFKVRHGTGGAVDTGVAVAMLDVEAGYVLTGIGGESKWTTGGGRMLFGLKPTGTHTGQIGVYSKDHQSSSKGYNKASLVQIRKAY